MIYKGYTIETDRDGYIASKKLEIFPHFKLYFIRMTCFNDFEVFYRYKHSLFAPLDGWSSLKDLQTAIDLRLQPKNCVE